MRERLRERWRDKTRDNLTSTLNSLGVQAGMADRGRDEENVGKGIFTRSLGVVDSTGRAYPLDKRRQAGRGSAQPASLVDGLLRAGR